jgi:long-chain acyl-CoA synthetase
MNLDWITDRLTKYTPREAIIYPGVTVSFTDILTDYDCWKQVVIKENIGTGEVVAITNSLFYRSFALFLALMENNNIVVPLSETAAQEHEKLLQIATADKVLTLSDNGYHCTAGPGGVPAVLLEEFRKKNHPGLILFTSGTTGEPKGVLHDFQRLMQLYGPEKKALRTVFFLHPDHIGGINTLFHTLLNGGALIIPESRDAQVVCRVIAQHKAELLPVTPGFLALLLLSGEYRKHDLSSLKIVSYGAEVMQEHILKKLATLFPGISFKQTYGLSEIGIMSTKSRSADSLWLKTGGEGFRTKIVDEILYIKAGTAMEGYLNAPSPFDEDGWLNTGDRVVCDGDYIRILGRQSEIINVGGEKVFPAEVEDLLLQVPPIENVVVFGEKNSILGHVVVAKVNLSTDMDAFELKRKVWEFCKDKTAAYKIPVKIYITGKELYNARYKKVRHI